MALFFSAFEYIMTSYPKSRILSARPNLYFYAALDKGARFAQEKTLKSLDFQPNINQQEVVGLENLVSPPSLKNISTNKLNVLLI